jgi:erythromycin esterase-like protein
VQQKRKLAKLREAQASIMQRHAEAEKKFKQKNAELTEEYRRITKQYKDLQQKFRHFEAADQVKFQASGGQRPHFRLVGDASYGALAGSLGDARRERWADGQAIV